MRTRVLPTSVIVRRNDPRRDRHHTPVLNARLPVVVQPETAPKPIDTTSFFGVGRDAQHAWPQRQLYQALAIEDKLSIRSQESAGNPLVQRVYGALVVNMPAGRQIPATERVNIQSPESAAYGSLSTLNPLAVFGPAYRKIRP